MKAYLMSLPKSLKGISDRLNVRSLLCAKTWVVFHEEKKVIFIFQKDGSLIVSQNGVASKGKWEYIKSNKTILVEAVDVMLLLHPTFVDDVLFILQQDGTDGYFVLIDEKQIGKFVQKTIAAIADYLRIVSGEAAERQQEEEAERKRKERERRAKAIEKAREMAKSEIEQATKPLRKKKTITIWTYCVLVVLSIVGCFACVSVYNGEGSGFFVLLGGFFFVFIFISNAVTLDDKIEKTENEIIENYLNKMKDAPEE
jgi:hypothetical protein